MYVYMALIYMHVTGRRISKYLTPYYSYLFYGRFVNSCSVYEFLKLMTEPFSNFISTQIWGH